MKWLAPSIRCDPPSSWARSSLTVSTKTPTHSGSPLALSQRSSSPLAGPRSGKNGTKWKRRRRAASIRAMDRSAVFMVPTNHKFGGSRNGLSGL